MGISNLFKKQFAQIITWENQQTELLVYKFPSLNNEIKNASKLVVSPGQGAILVYEGKITDIITQPAAYNLETDNHPFITTLLKLRTNFNSEHQLKVYFFRTAEIVNQNWGTTQAIKYMDPVYNFPIQLGANGSFSYKICNVEHLFTEVIGSKDSYSTVEARQVLQGRISQIISSELAIAGISYQQIDSHLSILSNKLKQPINEEIEKLGFEITDFKLNGTVFDPETIKRINKIADIIADKLAAEQGGLSYIELEKLKALRDAARNEGGLAAAGLQLGAGLELSTIFSKEKDDHLNNQTIDPVIKMQQLKVLLNEGIITQDEFDAKKKEWLDKI